MKINPLLLILFFTCAPAEAQLYKWVDSQGKVHYSDTPPTDKQKSEQTLNIPRQPSTPAAADSGKSWQDKETDFKKRRSAEAEATAKKQKEEQEAKTKRENCEQAKNQLSQLQSNAPVYTFSESTGRTLLDDSQRAEAIEKATKAVSEWCK